MLSKRNDTPKLLAWLSFHETFIGHWGDFQPTFHQSCTKGRWPRSCLWQIRLALPSLFASFADNFAMVLLGNTALCLPLAQARSKLFTVLPSHLPSQFLGRPATTSQAWTKHDKTIQTDTSSIKRLRLKAHGSSPHPYQPQIGQQVGAFWEVVSIKGKPSGDSEPGSAHMHNYSGTWAVCNCTVFQSSYIKLGRAHSKHLGKINHVKLLKPPRTGRLLYEHVYLATKPVHHLKEDCLNNYRRWESLMMWGHSLT